MNNGTGLAARYGGEGTLHGMTDIERQDVETSARLDRELGLVRAGARERQATRIQERPGWPGWAKPLGTVPDGDCQTCGSPLAHAGRQGRSSKTNLCGTCGHRLGGVMRARVKVALRLYRERNGTP